MVIQINTDKTLSGGDRMQDYFTSKVKEGLRRHKSHITRIEVHLKDENGHKEGVNDMTCIMEARLKGRQPIAITCRADTLELALIGAIDKVHNAIATIIDRLQKY